MLLAYRRYQFWPQKSSIAWALLMMSLRWSKCSDPVWSKNRTLAKTLAVLFLFIYTKLIVREIKAALKMFPVTHCILNRIGADGVSSQKRATEGYVQSFTDEGSSAHLRF